MKILFDTHAFLWWNEDNPLLSKKARRIAADPANELVLSVASVWEIIIKSRAGKLRLPESPSLYIRTRAAYYGIDILPVYLRHALALESLPPHHRDPFDRILIAQSLSEKCPVLTHDTVFDSYSASVIW